ncbi:hypothetical protein [Methanoregula sp.]|uniref:hypothetical protein n=1 Tax=Methanoregula sp. TaxID=2052170 RepID=UPI0025D1651A|nr:hypothetical protein [Methanoregula sp.]
MPPCTPFVIADYGAADGVNECQLFGRIVNGIHTANPLLKIRLVYADIADRAPFETFWEQSPLSELDYVEAEYIQGSFYESLVPEGSVNLGFSSTALHWLDTKSRDAAFFRHPDCIQANQIPMPECTRFIETWKSDWRKFFYERSREVAAGGMLFLSNLTSLGADQWPASAGYNNLRDICIALCREGRISNEELQAIFIPDYFATPDEMRALVGEDAIRQHFSLQRMETMTIPCAYFSRMGNSIDDPRQRRELTHTLARVVRAWSESSLRVGLSRGHAGLVDEIYSRLEDRFYKEPKGLPYQYCLMELKRRELREPDSS